MIGAGTTIHNSVIGLRTRIGENVTIRDSIVMGADFYQRGEHRDHDDATGRPVVGIGSGSEVRGAIVDKNCRIGANVRLVAPDGGCPDKEYPWGATRDGILVLAKNSELPDGWQA